MKKVWIALATVALVLGVAAPTSAVQVQPGTHGVKLNVLFIGAHPDDEAGDIAAFGTWAQYSGMKTGVVTITHGEGGGNAVGPETGPALGVIREAEERRAVGKAGINNIFYLDTVDFFYTVSSPLTEQMWGHDRTLSRIVRLVRETRPDIIITMDPAPSPGNHGNHQYAARLAVEAYNAAADPSMFPDQLAAGLKAWDVKRIFTPTSGFFSPPFGPSCASQLNPAQNVNVFGVYQGLPSARFPGESWLQVEFDAFGEYATQGFPSGLVADPNFIWCAQFTQIASRVPFGHRATAINGVFQGASVPAPPAITGTKSLPLGTELWITTDTFDVVAGQPFNLTVHAKGAADNPLVGVNKALLRLPSGWTATGSGVFPGAITNSHERTATFSVTPNGAPYRAASRSGRF